MIEFSPPDGDAWLAIHEVHYVDGRPTSYSESPASVGWSLDEGDSAPSSIIECMRKALDEPVLKVDGFETAG